MPSLQPSASQAGALLLSRAPSAAAPKEEQQQLTQAAAALAAASAAAAPAAQTAMPPAGGGGGGGGGGGQQLAPDGQRYDFLFPVEMGSGASQIYWNQGDDLEQVASKEVSEHVSQLASTSE